MFDLQRSFVATAMVCGWLALFASPGAQADSSGGYRVQPVQIPSAGVMLAGDLYIPDGVSAGSPRQGVVVTGAWTTIKEQMPGLYAAEMARRGYVALAFDFRTWGESGGPSRSLEDPDMKIADIEAAAEWLSKRPEVSAVNGLGICASAGYMATAAANSATLSSIALVAPWLHDQEIVHSVYGGPEGVEKLLQTAREAAEREGGTGRPQLIPAAGPPGSDALMTVEGYYTDPARGLIPEWENTFNLASWTGWLTFDGIRAATDIEQPVLIVHSDAAAIPQGARRFFARLDAPKRDIWLEGVTQFDFYDQPEPVRRAADTVAVHFAESGSGR